MAWRWRMGHGGLPGSAVSQTSWHFVIMCCVCLVLTIDTDTSMSVVGAVEAPAPAAPNGTEGAISPRTGGARFCIPGEKECRSGRRRCIPELRYCDGRVDCDDGSDEGEHCVNYDCGETRGKCPNKRLCTFRQTWWTDDDHEEPFEYYLCNGINDCRDGSDEAASFCRSFNCSQYQSYAIKCPSGVQCLWVRGDLDGDEPPDPAGWLCDGDVNCRDGSDETPAFCRNRNCSVVNYPDRRYIRCDGGRCVRDYYICDGRAECRDGSDERNCSLSFRCNATLDQFQCPTGPSIRCISRSEFCDGHRDCEDGSDEKIANCKKLPCPNVFGSGSGETKCNDGSRCIYSDQRCDGTYDCWDRSDENPVFCRSYRCENSKIPCPSGVGCLYSPDSLCNGRRDCLDGSDESRATCPNASSCATGRVLCHSPRGCQLGTYCNGIYDCRDGSDENAAFCRAYTCPAEKWKCGNRVRCIDKETVCDGHKDCDDNSDEAIALCRNWTCPPETWKCRDGSRCISRYSLCNGVRDCPDGSDELRRNC